MVALTDAEIKWLLNNYPQMTYDEKRSAISGLFSINLRYNGITIKDSFAIKVDLYGMKSRDEYPTVYNTDKRILNIANRKRMKKEDLHIYNDGSLCLGLPERFYEYYPDGFTLDIFFRHLAEHLYWVAYYERYNKAPWNAELHGDDALVEYYIEKKDIDNLRRLHRAKFGIGISRHKLQNYLKSEFLINRLKKKLLEYE